MVYEPFHFGGELACRMDMLDPNRVVMNTMTFDNVAESSLAALPNMGPKMEQRYPAEYELRTLINKWRQPTKAGFYYEAKLRFPLLDLEHYGFINSVINHCMKGGNYTVDFYPYSDNTLIHFITFITGEAGDFDEYQRPLVVGHSATLEVYGLEPLDERPFNAPEGIICLSKGIAYPAAETLNSQCGDKGVAYGAAEMEDDMGYVLNKNKAIV